MSTHSTMSLTAKIDLLRNKGCSDDEINQLLSSSVSTEPLKDAPFNVGEIFNNGSSTEEWNKQVDEAKTTHNKQGIVMLLFSIVFIVSIILEDQKFISSNVGFAIIIGAFICMFSISLINGLKLREKVIFFIKKRH